MDATTQTNVRYHRDNIFIGNNCEISNDCYLKFTNTTKNGIKIYVEKTHDGSTITKNGIMTKHTNREIAKILKNYMGALPIDFDIRDCDGRNRQYMVTAPHFISKPTKIFSNNDQEFIKKFC